LGVQWRRERTFAGREATDETAPSGAHYYDLKRFPFQIAGPRPMFLGRYVVLYMIIDHADADQCHRGPSFPIGDCQPSSESATLASIQIDRIKQVW
jgi:hypothetical protein